MTTTTYFAQGCMTLRVYRACVIRSALALLFLLLVTELVLALHSGASNNSYVLTETLRSDQPLKNSGNYIRAGHRCRTSAGGKPCVPTIDPAQKTLVLITAGASNGAGVGPSAYVPANINAIDNFNIYDGALYQDLDPLLGQTYSALGVGSIGPRLADLLITKGSFNRVILVPTAIGGSAAGNYIAGGALYDRNCVAMRRLASHGITPASPGVTFAMIWQTGENDVGASRAEYQLWFTQQINHVIDCGFSGRIFVNNSETIIANSTNPTIVAAQAAIVALGAPYFAGGNMDSLTGATYRQADGTHLTAAGQAAQAMLEYNAMHASGVPF